MQIDRASLVQRYEDLVDTELLRRLRSGELTELAHEVAMAELQARGLSLEPEAVVAPPAAPHDSAGIPSDEAYAAEAAAAPAEVVLAADQFERNPYQAPRAAQIQRREQRARTSWRDIAWWAYVGLLALMCSSSFVLNPQRLAQPAHWLGLAPLLGMTVGLAAWRLRRPLGHPLLWVALLALFLAQFAIALRAYVEILSAGANRADSGLLLIMLFVVAITLPGIWGLLCYAFFSSRIWRSQQAT
jgi:hypothetical protein